MATNTKLDSLVINYLTQSQYDSAKNAGTLNANQIYMTPASSGSTYTLPAATSSTLGGVKIGSNITVSSGTISISKTNVTNALGYTPPTTDTKYTLPTASAWTLGGVKIGSNITENSGTISLTKANVTSALGYTPPTTDTKYTLPTGNASTLGGVKLSDSTSSTSSTNGGIAATPKAVKDAYDASTEWVSLTVSSVYTVKSGITMWANTEKAYRRGRRIYLTFKCIGNVTSDPAGFIQIGTVQSSYRPKVNTYCPFGLNVSTSGQIFGPAVCVIKTTGEILVYTGKNSTTFGNNSYGWTTDDVSTISWDH
mgnify:CR=1 FL=1|jgi:hypothetical protein